MSSPIAKIADIKRAVRALEESIEEMPIDTKYKMALGFRVETQVQLSATEAKTLLGKYYAALSGFKEEFSAQPVLEVVPHNTLEEEFVSKAQAKLEAKASLVGISNEVKKATSQEAQVISESQAAQAKVADAASTIKT